jgi:hypothetical protein
MDKPVIVQDWHDCTTFLNHSEHTRVYRAKYRINGYDVFVRMERRRIGVWFWYFVMRRGYDPMEGFGQSPSYLTAVEDIENEIKKYAGS